jgi:hypothetical protein
MTVRDIGDSTEGLKISPVIDEGIDNEEIYYATFSKLSRISQILRNSINFEGEKDFFAHQLSSFLLEVEDNKDYVIARIFGVIEGGEYDEGVLPGFYVFFPVMNTNMAGEVMGIEEVEMGDTEEDSVLCWYVSYNGETALKMFKYPFIEDSHIGLVGSFKERDLDNGDDIMRLEYLMQAYMNYDELCEFVPNSYIGNIDPYLDENDLSSIRGDHPNQKRFDF